MPYTQEDGGRLNNFPVMPKMYRAEPPNAAQKRNYIIMGILSVALVAGLVSIAFFASNVS